jgi:oxygen-independent coproporphyrinogen-3 oxidase
VFIGGGTPTLLNITALSTLLGWIQKLAAPGAEITIECNPETVTPQLADVLVAGGVTRVSLGAQSLTPSVLSTLERHASPETVVNAFQTLRAAGIGLLSLDVIWGVPGQNEIDLAEDLKKLSALGPNHLSAYELEVKPGTRLAREHAGWYASDRDETDEFYDRVIDTLEAEGFHWYELANFARDGQVCHHNLGYWHASDYVGLGLGAVGTVDGNRRRNTPGIKRYLGAIEDGTDSPADVEQIDPSTALRERIMLGLRLAEGVSVTHEEVVRCIDLDGLQSLIEHGLILSQVEASSASGDCIRLVPSRRGRMLLNGVLGTLLLDV